MWRLSSLISLLLAGFIGIGFLAVREFRAENRINIILLTVESLRYDLVNEVNTPGLLAASETSLRFDQHHAVSAWTGTNIISLLTGLTPLESGIHTRGRSVNPELHLPLEQLAEGGYTVAGLQEFMTMDLYKNLGLAVEESGADLLYWLAGKLAEKTPFFLWEHYVYTHLPYRPAKDSEPDWQVLLPEPKSESIRRIRRVIDEVAIPAGSKDFLATDIEAIHALHSSTVKEFDVWFEGFWSFFKRSGLSRNTILILTADHGDEHGERGNVGHASTNHAGHLYEEIVHVPLFIWLPELAHQKISKRSVKVLTSHVDIMPTILSLLNLNPSPKLSGRNLLTAGGKTLWTGMTSGAGFSEQNPENIGYYIYGCRRKNWKILWRLPEESVQLYDVAADPDELHNVAEAYPDVVADLKKILAPLIAAQKIRPVNLSEHGSSDRAPAEKLRWLTPERSGFFRYDDLQGRFHLQWSGEPDVKYMLQYEVGQGALAIKGEMEVQGTVKDFGGLSRKYWNTWIVPYSPFRIRVAEADSDNWSDWIRLEALQ
ncbi:MAG: sulfatase-like hydrolase/transferase [Desulfobulbaceae bacterium]|nr:sulfatase-like hydrolase/transferase [Desulfobulbaceae bacterium]